MKADNIDAIPLVTLDELAARTGRGVEHVLRPLKDKVVQDWAMRPAVPADVAREFVQGYERERLELEELHKAWEAYLQAWAARRDRVYAEAYHEAASREVERMKAAAAEQGMILQTQEGVLPPDAQNRVFAAAREAVAAWEQAHPKPTDPADFAAHRRRYEKLED